MRVRLGEVSIDGSNQQDVFAANGGTAFVAEFVARRSVTYSASCLLAS
jgi:hypothetical protein